MKEFHETYKDLPKLSAVMRETHPSANNSFKDSEVVEYALSRTLSPTMVSAYKGQLPDKRLLQRKLRELFN